MSDRDKKQSDRAVDAEMLPPGGHPEAGGRDRPSPFGDVEGLGSASAAEEATEEVAPAPRRRGGTWLVAIVVIIVVFAAGLLTWPFAAQKLSAYLPAGLVFGSAMADRISAVEARLDSIEAASRENAAAVTDVRREIGSVAGLAAKVDTLAQRLDGIETAAKSSAAELAGQLDARLGALEAALAAKRDGTVADAALAALGERLAALERGAARRDDMQATLQDAEARRDQALTAQAERLTALETRSAAGEAARRGDARGTALVLAVAQLRAALKGSAPFATELATLKDLGAAGDAPGLAAPLAQLTPLAAGGVPTLAMLRGRYGGMAAAAVRAGRAERADWMGRTLARLQSLVTVRRVGDVAGADVDAIVARAESRLSEGDLAAAVAELDTLQGAPAEAAAQWLADARRRLAAEAAIDALHGAAIVGLSG